MKNNMKAILKKLRNDIRKTKWQGLLSLVAIILTIWGISTVYYGYWMTERDFKVNFDQTQPAHMLLTIGAGQLDLIKEVKEREHVKAVERREAFMGRVKDEDGEWMPILIFAVEDFQNLSVNTFKVEEDKWPGKGAIAIERKSAAFLGEAPSLILQLPGQDQQVLPITSYPHDPRLPSARMDYIVYGYLTMSTYQELDLNSEEATYLLRVTADYPSLQELERLENQIRGIAGATSARVSIEIPPLNEHPHQNVVDAVAVLQLGLGVILVLLGVTLLSLILLLWMLPQVREVALMKAIGASTEAIRKAYLALLLMAGGLGVLCGLPLGYISGRFFSRFIAFTQNFDPVADPLPVYVHLPVALGSLLIPLLIGWRPIAKAIKVSSIAGLQQVFEGVPRPGLLLLQRLIPSAHARYSLNSFLRNGARLFFSVALLSLGLALFFVGINLQHSLQEDTDRYFAKSTYHLAFRVDEWAPDLRQSVEQLRGVEKAWMIQKEQWYIEGTNGKPNKAIGLQILPLDFFFAADYWVQGEAKPDCEDCVWINQGMAHELGDPAVGQLLQATDSEGQRSTLRLTGMIKELAVGPAMYRYGSAYVRSANQALWVQLQESTSSMAETTQKSIETLLGKHLLGASNNAQRLQMLRDHLQPTFLILQAMGVLTIVMSLLGLGLLININMQERRKEIGILKALGTSVNRITGLLLQEIALLNGFGVLLALLLGYVLAVEMGRLLGDTLLHIAIPFHADWWQMILTVLVLFAFQLFIWFPYLRKKISQTSIDLVRA